MSAAMSRPFLKMNGLGNDFVVVEARSAPFTPTPEQVRAIANRTNGVGCDQLIVIEPPLPGDAGEGVDARVRFWNSDGEEVGACAALVAAARRDLTDRSATVVMDGGELLIEWRADDHVIMTGPAAVDFAGELP